MKGKCAFSSTLDAASLCTDMPACRSLVVFQNGGWKSWDMGRLAQNCHVALHCAALPCPPRWLPVAARTPLLRRARCTAAGTDGCSDPITFINSEALSPVNSYVAPSVVTLQPSSTHPPVRALGLAQVLQHLAGQAGRQAVTARSQVVCLPPLQHAFHARRMMPPCQLQVASRLYDSEGEVLLAPDADLAAGGAGLANSSSCFLGRNVVMAGKVVALLEGVASAEACCQECRLFQTSGGAAGCNVWNYCDAPGGCRCALCQAAPAA